MKIVILRALKVGDFLTAVPAFRAIRRAFPSSRIVLAAPRAFGGLLDLLDGAIDAVSDAHELEPLRGDACGADVGIDLHGCGPESQRLLLASGARRLIAFRTEGVPQSFDGPRFDASEHEVRRWCRLLSHFGIPADPTELDLRPPDLRVPKRVRGATLIHPGAASESRRWPVDRWIDVARAERRLGRHVILTGGPSEVERARRIATAAAIPSTDVYAGRTSLRKLAAIVAAAGRVVCGDTGIAHFATAFRRPSVLLFGPTPPATWGPPQRPIHRVLWDGATGDPHADRVDPGLAAIPADRVIAALATLPT